MPGTFKVLVTTATNKREKNLCPHGIYILEVEADAKQDHLHELNAVILARQRKKERGYAVAGDGRELQF